MTQLAYNPLTRRQTMLASGLQPVTYGYDANSRLTGLTQGSQSAALTYDAANRRTALTLPNGIVLSYSDDAASRLIGQTYTGGSGALGDLTYSYDATGNRLTTGGSFARSGLPTAISAASYDGANRQLTFGPTSQTFDANGNLLTQADATGTTTYTWDARNRLTTLTGPTVSATFTYDALGRRTTKTINGQSTSVLYDGLDTVQESGPDGDASYLRTLGIDEALSRTDATGTLTYLPDALGSTLALADSSGGLSTTYTYAPFGETAVTGLPSSSPFQFTGRENDGTGLYYYRARYYDPVRSRFVSEDPIGLFGGVNKYRYANANPLRYVDPHGQDPVIGAAIGMLTGGFYGGFGAILQNGKKDDIIAAILVGMGTGALVGALDPSLGIGTFAVIGGVSGGLGDFVGQMIGAGGDKCKRINWGSTIGAIVGGGVAGAGGAALGALGAAAGLAEGPVAIGGAVVTSVPATALPGIGANLWPVDAPACGCP